MRSQRLFQPVAMGLLLLPPMLILPQVRIAAQATAGSERQMENLDRGVVAMKVDGQVFVGWRLLGSDPPDVGFNVYRVTDGEPERINPVPITGATNLVDSDALVQAKLQYLVRPVRDGKEHEACDPVRAWEQPYLEIPIQPIDDYRPGDASVGDLDGDGQYEIVLHQVSRGRDNASAGITGRPILDAYELDGTHLWRIDLGINIREGQHYTQFIVYDLDGDGRAEVACKTADGTIDGSGQVIGDADKDWRSHDRDQPTYGRVLDGPEYLTVFDGRSGAALATTAYLPSRDPIDGWGGIGGNAGNDRYGNRCDRFLACVAYLDGQRPSLVMCRGVYGRTVLAAWDWRSGELTNRWVFDSGISYPPYRDASPFSAMGGHSLAVGDVDGDGRDEIVYHAMVVDDDGQGLYSTGLRHGDAMHLADIDPDRPGLEVFTIHENEAETVRLRTPGAVLRDAATGKVLWSHSPGVDVKAGLAADIDPRHRGCELWGGPGGLRNAAGKSIGPAPRTRDFVIWWDGDLLRELLSGSRIQKWNWQRGEEDLLVRMDGWGGWRSPHLMADLLGDWREEVLITSRDGTALRLYTTPIPTSYRMPTLMHDPAYRLAIAWQNVAYNKPPHPSFFLGESMAPPPRVPMRLAGGDAPRP